MGYAYESYSTIPSSGTERGDENPEGWSGNVNTNVQVSACSSIVKARDWIMAMI